MSFRIGFAKDIHQLVEGRPLILGTITIPSNKGEKAHSDGDVLIHAIVEAIFGALGVGDLGTFFPDTDSKYKDADSSLFLIKANDLLAERGYKISNIDTSIELETPKLRPYIEKMKVSLARLLNIDSSQISVKAGTNEKMDAVGKGEAVVAFAMVLLEKE